MQKLHPFLQDVVHSDRNGLRALIAHIFPEASSLDICIEFHEGYQIFSLQFIGFFVQWVALEYVVKAVMRQEIISSFRQKDYFT